MNTTGGPDPCLTIEMCGSLSSAAAEAAGLRMTAEPVDVAEVAGEAAAALVSSFDAAGVELVTELESATVSGDRSRLHQVVNMGNGGITGGGVVTLTSAELVLSPEALTEETT